jgi:hypothetical protein
MRENSKIQEGSRTGDRGWGGVNEVNGTDGTDGTDDGVPEKEGAFL